MHRMLLIAILAVLALFWLAFRIRKTHQLLATAMFTAASVVGLLIVGAGTGLIGG